MRCERVNVRLLKHTGGLDWLPDHKHADEREGDGCDDGCGHDARAALILDKPGMDRAEGVIYTGARGWEDGRRKAWSGTARMRAKAAEAAAERYS